MCGVCAGPDRARDLRGEAAGVRAASARPLHRLLALAAGGGGGAVGAGTDKVFYENDQTVTQSYTISAGKNAMVAGPIAVASGKTITIPSGSELTIV